VSPTQAIAAGALGLPGVGGAASEPEYFPALRQSSTFLLVLYRWGGLLERPTVQRAMAREGIPVPAELHHA
jgi:hypothetical protein